MLAAEVLQSEKSFENTSYTHILVKSFFPYFLPSRSFRRDEMDHVGPLQVANLIIFFVFSPPEVLKFQPWSLPKGKIPKPPASVSGSCKGGGVRNTVQYLF